jgi:peroxiredoxin
MNQGRLAVIIIAVVCLVAAGAYIVWRGGTPRGGDVAQRWNGDPASLLEAHRGQVLVLLLGMESCPGTRAATAFLKDYAGKKAPGVSIVRLDVPPPTGSLTTADSRSLPFAHGIDKDRLIAKQLDFFYYPTLYILDGDGEVRFSGACEPDRVREMVAEILAEQPGQTKRIYTPPLPAVGTTAPAFTGTTLAGEQVTLDELRGTKATVLIFAKTTCGFTIQAFPGMKQLADDFRDKGATVAIIDNGEKADTIRPIYAQHAPGVTVVADEAGEISASYSGDAVPFSFVLDADGRIASRMPYTFDDAARAVSDVLGLAGEAAPATTGAG